MKEASIPRICTYKIPANADYAFFCKVSYLDIRKKKKHQRKHFDIF